MLPNAYAHIISAADIQRVQNLGYHLHTSGGTFVAEDFINQHFPNFDTARLLEEYDQILNGLTSMNINRELHLTDYMPPEALQQYFSEDYYDEKTGLALCRTFSYQFDVKVVHHVFFRLPEPHRGKGIAKQIFRASLQQYVNIGIRKILVHAALEDGGYVWAKHYFTASDQREIKMILDKAATVLTARQFELVKKTYDNYYLKNPGGTAFPIQKWAQIPAMEPILRGSSWHGAIDFSNTEQFSNFISYVTG